MAAAFVAYLATFSTQYGPLILPSIFTPVFEIGVGPPATTPLRERREAMRDTYVRGDVAAKREAVEMLKGERGEPSPQVAALAEEEGGGGGAP